jgi:small-conductance mechanosensitive channel/CRP-like cAMP-binding protein
MDRILRTGGLAVMLPIAALVLYLIMLALGRWLKKSAHMHLGMLYQVFSAVVAVYGAVLFLAPTFTYLRELTATVALMAAVFLIALMQRLVWESYFREKRQVQVPNVVRDFIALVMFLVALMAVLSFGYDVRIPGLLAGSGIAAAVIGFAMQDLLGNIFAGLAIQIGKPFIVGDWLLVDDRHVEVMAIHWRSTRLRTNDHVYLDIPNNQLARQTIANFHYPTPRHALRVTVQVDYTAPPNRVKEVLARAAAQAAGVLRDPAPQVFLKDFGESGVDYEVRFWLDNHAVYNQITDAVRTNIWYALKRANLKIPYPVRTVQLEPVRTANEGSNTDVVRRVLRAQELLQGLDDGEIDRLAESAAAHTYCRGERLIEQDTEGASMFLMVRGEATVTATRDGRTQPVGNLRTGDCFGEMSLLTGEKRSATVVATADCEVVEIGHEVFGRLLKSRPTLAGALSDLMAKRRMKLEGILSDAPGPKTSATEKEYAAGFQARLRQWFQL